MRTLVAIAAFIVLLMQAHWTQRFEHVTLIQAGPCLPLVGAKPDGKNCVYSDVTVEGSLVRQELDVTAQDATMSISSDSMVGMSWVASRASSGFTWRTYLLFAIWLAITIWSLIPEIKKVREWLKGQRPSDSVSSQHD